MWKQLFGRSKKKVDTLADQGRLSVINPETSRSNRTRPIIKPDAKGRLKVLDFKFQDLGRFSPEQFISALISSSEDLSRAKNIYQEYVAEGYEVVIDPPEDTEAERIIDDFIERIELGGGTFISLLKRFVYGCYVEGAFCGELIFDQNGVDAIDIAYVSPFTISSRTVPDDDYGEVTEYGQGDRPLALIVFGSYRAKLTQWTRSSTLRQTCRGIKHTVNRKSFLHCSVLFQYLTSYGT